MNLRTTISTCVASYRLRSSDHEESDLESKYDGVSTEELGNQALTTGLGIESSKKGQINVDLGAMGS